MSVSPNGTVLNAEHRLPLMLVPESPWSANAEALIAWWLEHKGWVSDNLLDHGALLFRGFGVDDQRLLKKLVSSVSDKLLDYVDGNSPRTKMEQGVYTSTEYPPNYFISMHNELSYSKKWPSRLYFCCAVPPDSGGETPLVDSRKLLRKIDPEIVDEFRRKGVRYIRNLHGGAGFGPSWKKTFETEDRGVVEEFAREAGLDFEWKPDGGIQMTNVKPATETHPETGEEVWFNQADQFHPSTHPKAVYESLRKLYKGREDQLPQHATFGDGSEIPEAALDSIRTTTKELLVLFPWQKGDVLVVDNVLVSHGRMPFAGERKILVSMS